MADGQKKDRNKDNKYNKNVYRSLAMISQFGINMLVPIVILSFAGIYLDKYLGTSYWMVILFFVGALAGGRNIFVFARKIYDTPAERSRLPQEVASKDDKETSAIK